MCCNICIMKLFTFLLVLALACLGVMALADASQEKKPADAKSDYLRMKKINRFNKKIALQKKKRQQHAKSRELMTASGDRASDDSSHCLNGYIEIRLSFSPDLFLRECKCENYADQFGSKETFTINEYFYGSNSPYYSGYIYQECYKTNHGGSVYCEASKVDDGDNNCIDESDEPGLNDGGNTESSKDLSSAETRNVNDDSHCPYGSITISDIPYDEDNTEVKECKCANYQFLHFPDSFTYENYMDHYENIAAYIFDECDDPAEKFCYKGFEGDDYYDCTDWSDEIPSIFTNGCPYGTFTDQYNEEKCKCRNYDTSGEKFPLHYIGNTHCDCSDCSDEAQDECPFDSGQLFTGRFKNDFVCDCAKCTDEAFLLQCNSGKQLTVQQICDGFRDCPLGEDEDDTRCSAIYAELKRQKRDLPTDLKSVWHVYSGERIQDLNGETYTMLQSLISDLVTDIEVETDLEKLTDKDNFVMTPKECSDGTIVRENAFGDRICDCPCCEDESYLFYCDDTGDQYLPFNKLCDGVRDCPDGRDEAERYCTPFTCDDGNGNNLEIPFELLCDGNAHCGNREDEDSTRARCGEINSLDWRQNPKDGTPCAPQCVGTPCTETEMSEAWAKMGSSCS